MWRDAEFRRIFVMEMGRIEVEWEPPPSLWLNLLSKHYGDLALGTLQLCGLGLVNSNSTPQFSHLCNGETNDSDLGG